MIWHIFKKDFRLLWRFATVAAVLEFLTVSVLYQGEHGGLEGRPVNAFFNVLVVLQLIVSAALAAAAVHSDAVPGVRQDWLVRPIRRRDLLLAKLLFAVLLVQGPMLIADTVEAMASGIPFGQAIAAAIIRDLCMLIALYLPVLAFASITSSLTENIVAIVIIVAAYSLFSTAANAFRAFGGSSMGTTGVEWLTELALLFVAGVGAATVLIFQFTKRRTIRARWLTAGFAILCMFATMPPWGPLFAIQQRLSPVPGAASAIQLRFSPERGRIPGNYSRTFNGQRMVSVGLPIEISGLPPDTVLRADAIQMRMSARGLIDMDLRASGPTPLGTTMYTSTEIFEGPYSEFRGRPVHVDLDYSLTLMRLSDAHAMPARNDWMNIPGFGLCETRLAHMKSAAQLHCLMNQSTPPCATFFLENPATGQRNPPTHACRGQYTPLYTQYVPDALRRATIDLPFRDAADAAYPIDLAQVYDSRVVMRFYQPVEHFTRHVEISDMRLSDWASQ
jgi:hypothetical protein